MSEKFETVYLDSDNTHALTLFVGGNRIHVARGKLPDSFEIRAIEDSQGRFIDLSITPEAINKIIIRILR